MTDSVVPGPDTVAATGDPGDDTARRYRYQWTYAAILCCSLMDETEDVAEVFCEHHEDVLMKYIDGTFSGLQIKTRASDQEVWKTSDDAVRGSFARFAKLEAKFPDRFRAYRFLTNHPLHTAGNGMDLRYVLSEIRTAISVSDLSGSVAKFLTRVSSEAGCTTEVAFVALSKASAIDELPKLRDIEMRLVDTLSLVWPRAADCTHASVVRAARSLASECGQASSLAHQDVLPAYLPATFDPAGRELAARLAGKRFDRLRVLNLLERGLSEAEALVSNPEAFVEPGTGVTALLHQKLDAGGFSCVSRNSAEDLRDKADYLGIVWTKKYGRVQGLQQYSHMRSLVLSDAARAFEASKRDGDPFGIKMLSEIRSRFQQRRTEGSNLYDCSNEHLEGFAYSLTSECKVQWSLARPWEDE
ncbi:MAG: dsDNA nuclease domain-containing protein [Thermodesulfobacteriota bacterium]